MVGIGGKLSNEFMARVAGEEYLWEGREEGMGEKGGRGTYGVVEEEGVEGGSDLDDVDKEVGSAVFVTGVEGEEEEEDR